MAYFEHFPYTNFHDINLDRMIDLMEQFRTELQNFVHLNTVKYADPFDWNITTQYPTNTIVMDPTSGIAYISTQPVPAGAPITDTDYWTPIMDLTVLFDGFRQGVAALVEDSNTATVNSEAGRWIWVGNTLYQAQVPITAGDTYVPGGNVVHITVEDMIDALQAQDLILQGNIDTVATNLVNETTVREQAITNLQNEIADMKFPHYHATEHVDIYVAAAPQTFTYNGHVVENGGDDSHDGLSPEQAVRTLKRAFDIMAENAAGAYIHIIYGSTYNMGYPVISGCMLHLTGDVSGVTVEWGNYSDRWTLAFYNCYIHLDNMLFRCLLATPDTGTGDGYKGGYKTSQFKHAYLESGKLYANSVRFETTRFQTFGIIGGTAQFVNCTFATPLRSSGSIVRLENCAYAVPDNNLQETSMLHIYSGSTVSVAGTAHVTPNATANWIVRFLSMTASTLIMLTSFLDATDTNQDPEDRFKNWERFGVITSSQLIGSDNRMQNLVNAGNHCDVTNSTINGNYQEQTWAYAIPAPSSWYHINPNAGSTESSYMIADDTGGAYIIITARTAASSGIYYILSNFASNTLWDVSNGAQKSDLGSNLTFTHEQNSKIFTFKYSGTLVFDILVFGAIKI